MLSDYSSQMVKILRIFGVEICWRSPSYLKVLIDWAPGSIDDQSSGIIKETDMQKKKITPGFSLFMPSQCSIDLLEPQARFWLHFQMVSKPMWWKWSLMLIILLHQVNYLCRLVTLVSVDGQWPKGSLFLCFIWKISWHLYFLAILLD